MDLLDLALRRNPAKARPPDRCHVAVVMNLEQHGNVRPVEPVPPGATCDATLHRLVIGADGEPLDIGRANRE